MVIPAGIFIFSSFSHHSKAAYPILITLSPIVTLLRFVQPLKAFSPIVLTLFPITAELIFSFPANTPSAIFVTGYLPIFDGMSTYERLLSFSPVISIYFGLPSRKARVKYGELITHASFVISTASFPK